MQIEAVSSVPDFWVDDRVVVTGKDVDVLVRDVVRVVDVPTTGPFVGFLEERLKVGGRSFHAGTGRREAGAEIAQETIYGRPLCTIIRPAGNDADAFDNGRPGDPELHSHEGAGRDARDRAFLYVCIVSDQRRGRGLSHCRQDAERGDD